MAFKRSVHNFNCALRLKAIVISNIATVDGGAFLEKAVLGIIAFV